MLQNCVLLTNKKKSLVSNIIYAKPMVSSSFLPLLLSFALKVPSSNTIHHKGTDCQKEQLRVTQVSQKDSIVALVS